MPEIIGTDAAEYIRKKFGNYPEFEERVQEERMKCYIGQMIYDARTEFCLSQEKLAEMVGVEQDVIAQLEEADFDFEEIPFSIILKVANALNKQIKIQLISLNTKTSALQYGS